MKKRMPKPNHYYPNYGGLRFGQANNKMIKVKKQIPANAQIIRKHIKCSTLK
jgi:hypothetical protein